MRPGNTAALFQEMSRRCEPLATLYPIWLAQDLNLWPPAPETNALLHDQLFERNHITLTLLFTKWSLYASSVRTKYNTSGRKSSKQCSSLAYMMNSSLFPINPSLQKHMTLSEKTHRSPFNSCNLGIDVYQKIYRTISSGLNKSLRNSSIKFANSLTIIFAWRGFGVTLLRLFLVTLFQLMFYVLTLPSFRKASNK